MTRPRSMHPQLYGFIINKSKMKGTSSIFMNEITKFSVNMKYEVGHFSKAVPLSFVVFQLSWENKIKKSKI